MKPATKRIGRVLSVATHVAEFFEVAGIKLDHLRHERYRRQ